MQPRDGTCLDELVFLRYSPSQGHGTCWRVPVHAVVEEPSVREVVQRGQRHSQPVSISTPRVPILLRRSICARESHKQSVPETVVTTKSVLFCTRGVVVALNSQRLCVLIQRRWPQRKSKERKVCMTHLAVLTTDTCERNCSLVLAALDCQS